MRSRAWIDDAACGDLPPRTADALFFGRPNGAREMFTRTDLTRARAICNACPVLWACLDDALAVPRAYDKHGLRAGLLPDERATLRETGNEWPSRATQALYQGSPDERRHRGARERRAS